MMVKGRLCQAQLHSLQCHLIYQIICIGFTWQNVMTRVCAIFIFIFIFWGTSEVQGNQLSNNNRLGKKKKKKTEMDTRHKRYIEYNSWRSERTSRSIEIRGGKGGKGGKGS